MKTGELLESTGLKLTKTRSAILKLLKENIEPLDVSMITFLLKKEKVDFDQATVYRFLEILTNKGIVNRLEFGEGRFRYELNNGDHHHLICQNCGKIDEIEDKFMNKVESEIKEKKRFIVKSHSLEFFGVCKQCQQ